MNMGVGNEPRNTKELILQKSAMLFAQKGYSGVSMRMIAEAVGIQQASIYHHYKTKGTILEAIIDDIRSVYLEFFKRMDEKMALATCFEDVLDNFFSELLEVYGIYIYYGISLLNAEQFRDKGARKAFINDIMGTGIDYSKRIFDASIERGWVKGFDTLAFAETFQSAVVVGTYMRTHEDMQHKTLIAPKEMFLRLRALMLSSVEIIKDK